jgi:transposase
MVDTSRPVTGGVDTHLDLNVTAALDRIGGLLGVESFPTSPEGNGALLAWLKTFGTVAQIGVEGTGWYGAPLARYLRRAGVSVVEVDRPNRQERRPKAKTDELDAIEAARAAQAQRQLGAAKSRDGNIEAIRALVVAKRSAKSTKVKTLNQTRHLGFTAPEEIRLCLQDLSRRLIARHAASMRPRAGSDPVIFATKTALRTLRRRVLALDAETKETDQLLTRLLKEGHEDLLSLYGWVSTAPPRCWSRPATTPNGSAARPPPPGCARWRPSPPHQARSCGYDSIPAGTVKPTPPYGTSSSPA